MIDSSSWQNPMVPPADGVDVVRTIDNSLLQKVAQSWRRHSADVDRSMERLATGKRINRASDDPAASVAVTDIGVQVERLNARLKNVQQTRSYVAAREGGNAAVTDLIIEIKGLVVQAGNTGALSDTERRAIQEQIDSKVEAIDFVSNTFTYKGERVFNSALSTRLGASTRSVEAPNPDDPGATLRAAEPISLRSLMSGGRLNTLSGNLEDAARVVDAALETNSAERAFLGDRQRELDAQERTIRVEIENTSGAKSQIEDTDYASEVAKLVKGQVLQQASRFMMQAAMEQMKQLTDLIAAATPSGKVRTGGTLNAVG